MKSFQNNLPPGCTARDVEGAQTVECDRCEGKGEIIRNDGNEAIEVTCPECDGTGQILASEQD